MATQQYTTAEGRQVSDRFANALSAPQNTGSAQQILSTLTPSTTAATTPAKGSSVITSESMGQTPKLVVPSTTNSGSTSAAISGGTDQLVETHQSEIDRQLAQKVEADKLAVAESGNAVTRTLGQMFNIYNSRATEEANSNLPELGQIKNDSINSLMKSKRAQQKEIESARTRPGATMLSVSREEDAINRRYASEQVDLSINYDIANRNYTSVLENVNRKIELQLEPLKLQFDYVSSFYRDNREQLSRSETNQLNLMMKRDEAKINGKTEVGNLISKLMETNPEAVTPKLLKELTDKATNGMEASMIMARNGISLRDPLDTMYKKAQINKIYADIAETKRKADQESGYTEVTDPATGKKTVVKTDYTAKQKAVITTLNENVSKNATYAKTTSMRTYAENVAASLSLATGVGDLAAINQFQKVIDEGAVTRDQDVKLIQSSQSLLNSLKTQAKKLEKGEQLSPELRQQMKTAVESIYDAQVTALSKDPYIAAKIAEAELYNLNTSDTILGQLGAFAREGESNTTTRVPYQIFTPDGKALDLSQFEKQ